MKKAGVLILVLGSALILYLLNLPKNPAVSPQTVNTSDNIEKLNPLSIEYLRQRDYPESDIVIEETLSPGINYDRYIGSYNSDGNKIYGLFTVPKTQKPDAGYPIIVFLHGYLPPKQYTTTERYVAYQDSFARNGYITFKPDLRGHGNSEGQPVSAHFSHDYVIDTLNLISTLKSYTAGDSQKIGLWGHSNGGEITLRTILVSKDVKAAVIWAGVVGSYEDMLKTYKDKIPFLRNSSESANLETLNKIDPYLHLNEIDTPVQLHHGTADTSVPVELSRHLKAALQEMEKTIELYEYLGADHNISAPSYNLAMERSVNFFNKYLKD